MPTLKRLYFVALDKGIFIDIFARYANKQKHTILKTLLKSKINISWVLDCLKIKSYLKNNIDNKLLVSHKAEDKRTS